jgi:hypothetical protein
LTDSSLAKEPFLAVSSSSFRSYSCATAVLSAGAAAAASVTRPWKPFHGLAGWLTTSLLYYDVFNCPKCAAAAGGLYFQLVDSSYNILIAGLFYCCLFHDAAALGLRESSLFSSSSRGKI